MARANSGLSDHVTKPPELSTLIEAQFSALNMAAERRTSDEMEATHQCAHNQQRSLRRLEAADCDCMRYALHSNNSFPVGGDIRELLDFTRVWLLLPPLILCRTDQRRVYGFLECT